MTSRRLKEVQQHLVSNVVPQDEALYHGMVIVEPCINARGSYFFFKVFRAVERVCMGRAKDGAADGKGHVGSPEIAFQDFRYRARKTPVSRWVFRVIRRSAEWHPCRVGNRGGIPVDSPVLNRRQRPPEAEVVLRIHAANKGIGHAGPHDGKEARRVGRIERAPCC